MKIQYSKKAKRRRWLKYLGAAAVGGAGVYTFLEGVPRIGGLDVPGSDPMTTTFRLDRVFSELAWGDDGIAELLFVSGHDTIGFTITEEGADPVQDSLYTGYSPSGSGPVELNLSGLVADPATETYSFHALGGDLESLFTQPEVVTSVSFDIPSPLLE